MRVDWKERFIELAKHVAGWSKDKSTGVGAIIVDDDKRVVSMGYNGFPAGCDDEVESRHERPAKYMYTEHAERNAIYSAARIGISLKECTMYLSMFPCSDCARGIIQSGIKTVVCPKPDLELPNWGEHFKVSLDLFKETDVTVIHY